MSSNPITDDRVRKVFEQNSGKLLTIDDLLKLLNRDDAAGQSQLLYYIRILVLRRFIYPKFRDGVRGYMHL